MVVFPKVIKTKCTNACKKHTNHKVLPYKKNKDRYQAQGTRRYRIKQRGFGGQTKPIFRKNAKTTKKIVVKLQCSVCKKMHQRLYSRCKTFVLQKKK